ncbi:MAG: hypothetical protein NZ853_05130 [Leptospiraceae bacterium]|nr:hypothetical protein [Leptospiraceae bacterium]MDW7976670.1 MqnA/MqnD/SBP family protein [Leptospiraceae bacterium]
MLEKKLSFGLTPCPNDTFIFYQFLKNPFIEGQFHDIEVLNELAFQKALPLIKVSCATAVKLQDYIILSAGGAMGYDCGPILISNFLNHAETWEDLYTSKIYIPGRHTTANFLFHQFSKENKIPFEKLSIHYVRYDQILPLLVNNQERAYGILIHEERFTYKKHSLNLVLDLGEWWYKEKNLPIPLGCIVLHQEYHAYKEFIEDKIRESLLYSQNHYFEVLDFMKKHAQTMDEDAIKNHVNLYVTKFSYDVGVDGWNAIQMLKTFINQS